MPKAKAKTPKPRTTRTQGRRKTVRKRGALAKRGKGAKSHVKILPPPSHLRGNFTRAELDRIIAAFPEHG